MSQNLSEMSLEELWQLFPIVLAPHNPCWHTWYGEEAAFLRQVVPAAHIRQISHIGSTAIATIWAKPIVDILLELAPGTSMQEAKERLLSHGYLCMSQEEGRISLNKGYTPNGFAQRVFHLHLRHAGDTDELYFRDYLLEHPAVAKEYETLKLGLWKRFEHNRDAYTQSKTEFIQAHTQKAKAAFPNRYSREPLHPNFASFSFGSGIL